MRGAAALALGALGALGTWPLAAPADGLSVDGSLFLGSWSPYATRYTVRRAVCAWSDVPGRTYRVIAHARDTPGGFALVGDVGDRVRYTVRWRDATASGTWEALEPGMPSGTAYRFADASGCPDGGTEILIVLSGRDADGAPGGVYSSTLELTLTSE